MMRPIRSNGYVGWPAVGAVVLLLAGLPAAEAQPPTASPPAGEGSVAPSDQQALLDRIAELSRDPRRSMWMSGEDHRDLILNRRREQLAKIHEFLERFGRSPARETVLEYKLEALFATSMLTRQPPAELKALVQEILAGKPGRSLEGTASFWQLQVKLQEKSGAGAGREELAAYQNEQLARLADAYPENKYFGDTVLGIMAQSRLMEGRIKEARAYYQALQKYHPDSEMIAPLADEFRRRAGLSKPFELAFTDIRGRKVDLSKMKGKVVLVEFWASWCGPCVMSVPKLKRTYGKYHAQGFEIIGINLDRQRQNLEAFLKSHQIPWPQYFDGKGWNSPLAVKYGVSGIPTMFLVDKKGLLRSIDVQGALEEEVARLLAE